VALARETDLLPGFVGLTPAPLLRMGRGALFLEFGCWGLEILSVRCARADFAGVTILGFAGMMDWYVRFPAATRLSALSCSRAMRSHLGRSAE
jgi:hypothetical protein